MTEREEGPVAPSSINIEKDVARNIIIEAFEEDPTLEMRGHGTIYWDLSVKYRNESHPYRKGDDVDLCIYHIPGEDEILISQIFPQKGQITGNPLRIFLIPDSDSNVPVDYYTSRPKNWYPYPEGSYLPLH
jgi:hypothetical protein